MNIFQRAHLNLDLDPQERAFLKWLGASGLASPWVILVWFAEWWLLPGGVIWWTVVGLALILFFYSGTIGLTKFFTSQKDGPTKIAEDDLQEIFNAVWDRVESKLGLLPPVATTSVVPAIKPIISLPQQPPSSSMI